MTAYCAHCNRVYRKRTANQRYCGAPCRRAASTAARVSSTARGYGHEHRQAVKRLRATFTPGDECRRCHRPMWDLRKLDAGHPPDRPASTGSLPDALEHRSCNRSAGARNANRVRWHAPTTLGTPSRQW